MCSCRSISKDKIESFVFERIKDNILTEENIEQLVHLSIEEFTKNNSRFETQLSEVEQQLGQVDMEDLAPRIKEVRAQQKELEDKRNELLDGKNEDAPRTLDSDKIREYVASLKTFLGSSSFIEQKSFLKSFIKRIELNEPQVVIDYTMPLPIKGLTATEEVLYIDGVGSPTRIRT